MEQFTNLYQLTKTLKFKLEPHQALCGNGCSFVL